MFIVAGFNIYPSEIEKVVCSVPGVKQCCVVGKQAQVVGRKIVCFVIADETADRDALKERILQTARKELPEYARFNTVVFRKEFPKTKMNKVDYHALERSANDD